jgi:hypothetical protein
MPPRVTVSLLCFILLSYPRRNKTALSRDLIYPDAHAKHTDAYYPLRCKLSAIVPPSRYSKVGARRVAYPGKVPIRRWGHSVFAWVHWYVSSLPPPNPPCKLSLQRALQKSAFRARCYHRVCHPPSISARHLAARPRFLGLALTLYTRGVDSLAPFPLCAAFPRSEYYGASDAQIGPQRTALFHIPV